MTEREAIQQLIRYSPETGELWWRRNMTGRGSIKAGDLAGGLNAEGYIQVGVNRRRYLGHRLAWLLTTGVWPASDLDHINRVRDDNRWCNLRLATKAENMQNIARAANAGVWWDEQRGKWQVRIKCAGKSVYLGRFWSKNEALDVRAEAVALYHPRSVKEVTSV